MNEERKQNIRKGNAMRAMMRHDANPLELRELANEYGENVERIMDKGIRNYEDILSMCKRVRAARQELTLAA